MPTTSLKLDTDRDERSEESEMIVRGVRSENQSSLLRCHEVTGKTKSDSNKLTKRMNTVPLAAGSTECDSGIRRASKKHEVS